jgi:predicted nucleic acid-binding protein
MEVLIAARLHRTVPLPDVLIAALAVEHRLTVLHDDRDFERIQAVYGGRPGVERLRLPRP